MEVLVYLILVCYVSLSEQQQRVAPGVPPQQYQHVPPHHQQQQQYQQVPVQQQQFQQVPVQQHNVPQQQVPVQQVPMQQQLPVQQQIPIQQHHGSHHQAPGQILNAANVGHEREHIAEHFQVPIDTAKMSEQELQFHYFKMHDADNNNKLDGCELVKSLIHWHENEREEKPTEKQTDEKLSSLIDPILQNIDIDKDGFIEYSEFKNQDQAKRHS